MLDPANKQTNADESITSLAEVKVVVVVVVLALMMCIDLFVITDYCVDVGYYSLIRIFIIVFFCKRAGGCCDEDVRMEYDEISTDTSRPPLLAEHESLLSGGLSVELTASQVAKTAVWPTVSFDNLYSP